MAHYMNKIRLHRLRAFSLVEVLTVLTITVMVTIATITIYNRVRAAAASVNRMLDESVMPIEILQRIAEDLDKLAAPGLDTRITIQNKFDSGYNISQLIIENRFFDKDNKPQIFEKIVWQSSYDPIEDALILYRSHSGINLEDKITEVDLAEMQQLGSELFIPICTGITSFSIQVPKGEVLLEKWTSDKLPKAVVVTISFAEPFETTSGELEVPQEDQHIRTIAIDRTRKIKYRFIKRDFDEEYFETKEPNELESGLTDRENENERLPQNKPVLPQRPGQE